MNNNIKKIEDYEIVMNQELGHGAFGTVYLGYNAKQRKVAVKVIPMMKIKNLGLDKALQR